MSRQTLDNLTKLDGISRHRFSVAAAEILASVLAKDRPTMLALVAGGQDEFLRVAGRIYADHQFKQADLIRIFQRIKRMAQGQSGDPVTLTHG